MFGFMKSPANRVSKQKSVDPSNPFDSDSNTESDNKQTLNLGRRTASEPMLVIPDLNNNGDNHGRWSSSSAAAAKDKYKNDFCGSGGLENLSVQELENYAMYKAEETTSSVNNCLRISENIREDATKTLDMLHQQGEQITRSHMMAAEMEKDLSRGEKLLNNIGGMFSKPWKPKKTREITGPIITSDTSSKKKNEKNSEQREKLGLAPGSKPGSASRTPPPEPANALQKVEQEKNKQDDALSDLSNILGDLKSMAVDMGSEIDRQNKALDHFGDDVDELNARVKGANQRARHLLNK